VRFNRRYVDSSLRPEPRKPPLLKRVVCLSHGFQRFFQLAGTRCEGVTGILLARVGEHVRGATGEVLAELRNVSGGKIDALYFAVVNVHPAARINSGRFAWVGENGRVPQDRSEMEPNVYVFTLLLLLIRYNTYPRYSPVRGRLPVRLPSVLVPILLHQSSSTTPNSRVSQDAGDAMDRGALLSIGPEDSANAVVTF